MNYGADALVAAQILACYHGTAEEALEECQEGLVAYLVSNALAADAADTPVNGLRIFLGGLPTTVPVPPHLWPSLLCAFVSDPSPAVRPGMGRSIYGAEICEALSTIARSQNEDTGT